MPPASSSPTISKQLNGEYREQHAQPGRGHDADQDRARALRFGSKPAAASPMTTALSPASTRSMAMTWSKAAIDSLR